MLIHLAKDSFINHLEIVYTLSKEDIYQLKKLKGTFIRIHFTKNCGGLIDVYDIFRNFEVKEVNFYDSFNLCVVFNILMAHSSNTTVVFHCKRLYLFDRTILETKYTPDSYYYEFNSFYRYVKEHNVKKYLLEHPFLNVLANNFEITTSYFKFTY
jgi:hypothetical protein